MGIISLLPWIDMMKEIPSILRLNSFPSQYCRDIWARTLWWLASVYDAIKDDHRVFGWTSDTIQPFTGTDLDIRLRERRVTTVVLTGVLTDICVLHTAIDAYNLGYDIEGGRECNSLLDAWKLMTLLLDILKCSWSNNCGVKISSYSFYHCHNGERD